MDYIVKCRFSIFPYPIWISWRTSIKTNRNTNNFTVWIKKIDSKTRTYLGTTYETLVNKFITPLNLRLVKNNRPTLSSIQSKFTEEQAHFKEEYTNYMRELEELIALDCQNSPKDFYQKLETVREKRAKLRETTAKLTEYSDEQYFAVKKMQEELWDV